MLYAAPNYCSGLSSCQLDGTIFLLERQYTYQIPEMCTNLELILVTSSSNKASMFPT